MSEPSWSSLLDEEATQAAALLAAVLPRPLHTLGLDGVRAFAAPQTPPRTTPMAEVREHRAGSTGVRVREYRPRVGTSSPAVLYLHGGGFTVGSLDGVDELCRRIAAGADCAVFSVEYRLAPEHPYPAALDDVRAAYAWLVDGAISLDVDPDRVAVAGDSAGAGLATSLCLDLRERGHAQPVLQLLVYPAVDDSFARRSWTDFADAPLLGADDARWFWRQYVGEAAVAPDELAAPMRATSLAGLAPAHVITAEVDPLRDDAEAYADRLAAEGVAVTRKRYAGVFHCFFTEVETYATARRAVSEACARLRAAFGSEDPDAAG
ncbi:alpha/beta hydrolase [Nocardioides antri]|uniref:Alpha/beta hydrolase n=1 Tax=Nocardioides antri TaxID=2607659 RepID=A0A5B1M4H6_9ACTN|nr:alpha/beta hydrolase [Nocardioides antri]KAA1427842.1 alpha/beta hydrolase [Nocardioides antri]